MASSRRYNNSSINSLLLLNVIVFMVCVGIYLINRVVPAGTYGFRQMYLNDLLAMPLLLSYSQILCIWKNKLLTITHILGLLVISSVMWEVVTPIVLSYSVSDCLDVMQYCLGTIVYITIWKVIK